MVGTAEYRRKQKFFLGQKVARDISVDPGKDDGRISEDGSFRRNLTNRRALRVNVFLTSPCLCGEIPDRLRWW
jgi:hypothetical protein